MTYPVKRQHDRARVGLDVTFMRDGALVAARTRDISLGGAFIETDAALAHGVACTIELKLPALPTAVQVAAIVRWVAADGMGVQWGALGARESWAINQVLRR